MLFDQGAAQVEAQPGATNARRLGVVRTHQAAKDPCLLMSRNPHPMILHAELGDQTGAIPSQTTQTGPPCGLYLMALGSRFASTCSMRWGSMGTSILVSVVEKVAWCCVGPSVHF